LIIKLFSSLHINHLCSLKMMFSFNRNLKKTQFCTKMRV
jgi:hypothetical protein